MSEKKWANERLDDIYVKTLRTLKRHGNAMIPYQAVDGVYRVDMAKKDIVWWTNGFWSGWLWQLEHYRHNDMLVDAARINEAELDKAFLKYEGLHHDVGFMWLPSAITDYRLTNDKYAYWRGRHAADLLAGRYNPIGHYLRSWNSNRAGWVIIDSMLNVNLLFWASAVTKDPRFAIIGNAHAQTVMTNHVRQDGAVSHIVVFDPETGKRLKSVTGQGYDENSSWTRGQGWAIEGFAMAYANTKKLEYLATAKKVANYFLANVATTDYVPVVDFRAPSQNTGTDTSAATIAASGMLEISRFCEGTEADLYRNSALRILHAVSDKFADYSPEKDGILTGASTAYHDEAGWNVNLNYGDYYFIEALLRLLDNDVKVW